MCDGAKLLSNDELDEHWRAVRKSLIADGDVVPTSAADHSGPTGWVHRIAAPERGCLLVTKPNVFFKETSLLHRSVLLVLEHDEEVGSLAIALNRPTDSSLVDVLENDAIQRAFGDRPLHLGGTSAEDGNSNVFLLCAADGDDRDGERAFTGDDEASRLLPGLWLTGAGEAATRVLDGASPADAFHFYAGAFVWAPGKLEEEFKKGAYHALAASAPLLDSFLLGGDSTPDGKYTNALLWAKQSNEGLDHDDDNDDVGTTTDGSGDSSSEDAASSGGSSSSFPSDDQHGAVASTKTSSGGSELRGLPSVRATLHSVQMWLAMLKEERTLGLIVVLVGKELGLAISLVEMEACGLLLCVPMGSRGGGGGAATRGEAGEEPPVVYMSLEPGEGCLRLLDASDCLPADPSSSPDESPRHSAEEATQGSSSSSSSEPPQSLEERARSVEARARLVEQHARDLLQAAQRQATEDEPAAAAAGDTPPPAYVLEPLEVALLLAEEWGEAFRYVEDRPRADFWELQRHTLEKLLAKLEEQRDSLPHDGSLGAGGGSRREGMPSGRGGRGGRGGLPRGVKGVVVRVHRPPRSEDKLDFGI